MSTFKTRIDIVKVKAFVADHLHVDPDSLQVIEDGEVSQAFFLDTPNGPRVLRVNTHNADGFKKDQLAYEHFSKAGVPIPKIREIGEIEPGVFFAISDRVAGKTLNAFGKDVISQLMPELMNLMDIIHAIPPMGSGFGVWDQHGNASHQTYKDWIISSINQDDDETRGADFYDTTLHDSVRDTIVRLLDDCGEPRSLVHGDFDFGNVLSDSKAITGVIDWHGSFYGDPLYDVAWFEFWDYKQGYQDTFRHHFESQGTLPDNFDQRMRMLKLNIGLNSLGFFARSRQPNKYKFALEQITPLMNNGGRHA